MPPHRESQRALTQTALIKILEDANAPRDHLRSQSAPTGSNRMTSWRNVRQTLGKTNRVLSALNRNASALSEQDEEAKRTRKYWEKFAKTAAKELLKNVGKPREQILQEQLLYSGRVGVLPKYPPKIADNESVDTDIELMSCSEVEVKIAKPKLRKTRKAKQQQPEEEEKTNWEVFAKKSHGMLDRMMQQDADVFQSVKADPALNKSNALDLMTEEEQSMLMACGFQRGIATANKAFSTENLVTVGENKTEDSQYASNRTSPEPNSRSATPLVVAKTYLPGKRSQSPKVLADQFKQSYHLSSLQVVNDSEVKLSSRAILDRYHQSQPEKSPFSCNDVIQDSMRRFGGGMLTGNIEGRVSHQVQTRLDSTVTALDRLTGFGDHRYEMNTIDAEKGLFTETDYSKVPRYPQNIRIAPQLAHIIKDDIRDRLRKPRPRPLNSHDLIKLNKIQPNLDSSQRNLVIFNWLNSLDETEYLYSGVPEIRDPEFEKNRQDLQSRMEAETMKLKSANSFRQPQSQHDVSMTSSDQFSEDSLNVPITNINI